jgi:hypothetical protein
VRDVRVSALCGVVSVRVVQHAPLLIRGARSIRHTLPSGNRTCRFTVHWNEAGTTARSQR